MDRQNLNRQNLNRQNTDRAGDRGSISGFVVVITLTVMACAGLALDGARLVGEKISVADHAENAARAGAQELSSLHDGAPTLDPGRARQAAETYLAVHGLAGSVVVTPDRITVTVRSTVAMTLLRLAGVGAKTITATRSSTPVSLRSS